MVYIRVAPLVMGSFAFSTWAATIPHSHSGRTRSLEKRDGHVIPHVYYCPEQVGEDKWKCDDERCGGEDPDNKGQCLNWIYQSGESFSSKQAILVESVKCECSTDDDGSHVAPIIPIPIIVPPGFLAAPPAVPAPEASDTCPEDFTETKCKDCDSIEGWCTTGLKAGCPCQEDQCPADGDDDFPVCSDQSCEGADGGKCTIGRFQDCSCKQECPNQDETVLDCSADDCKAGDDSKCTVEGPYNGCGCTVAYDVNDDLPVLMDISVMDAAMAELSTILEDGQKSAEEEEIKSSISCSDDKSKAIGLDTDFAKKFAEKFCSGDSQSADLSSSDVGLSGYEDYRFHFQYDAGQNCSQSCGDVFSTMIDNCQGLDSHSVQPSASASLDSCGASFMYSFEQPNPTPSCDLDKSVDLPADVFTSGIYDKFCDSFQEGKQQTWVVNQNGDNPTKKRGLQRRTPPANANSYSNYRTTLQFDVTGSMSCSMSCADAFKSIAQSPCGRAGSQQNVMSKEASIDINCGTLSYVIRDKDEPEYATLEVGEQKCFPADKWGDFPKMPSKDDSSWDQYFLHNACGASMPHQKVSADHQLSSFYGDNGRQQYHFDVKWIPGCQLKDQTEQDLTDPLGSDSDAHCGTLFKNTYFDCMDGDAKNGGAGGWIDVGCVRYLFKPTNTRD